jgi:hypothetical protein
MIHPGQADIDMDQITVKPSEEDHIRKALSYRVAFDAQNATRRSRLVDV